MAIAKQRDSLEGKRAELLAWVAHPRWTRPETERAKLAVKHASEAQLDAALAWIDKKAQPHDALVKAGILNAQGYYVPQRPKPLNQDGAEQ